MFMQRFFVIPFLFGIVATSSGCGPEQATQKNPSLADAALGPRHDYTSTWVYAVGEVNAPTARDCSKALTFVEAESDCIGAACKYGNNLVRDFEFGCQKVATAEQRQRAAELRSRLAPRAAKPPTDCAQQVEDWLERGCGREGACEPQIQHWATRCLEEIRSPLALHLLERLVENSMREPRRVKFDVRSCAEYEKKLEEAASCSKQFDCEDAMPRIDEYLDRCAEPKRKAIALTQAVQIARIRSGAEKPFTPIPLTEGRSKATGSPGILPLAAGGGAVVTVCGDTVSDLATYLEQRKKCNSGEIGLLMPVDGADGLNLEQKTLWHESDSAFLGSYSKLLVEGEAEVREGKLFDEFAATLGAMSKTSDLAGAFERTNLAYAALSPSLRQSAKLYAALAGQDAALVKLFGLLGDQKARLFGRRLNDRELLGLLRRSEKLVFADMSNKGRVDIGKSCQLSELMLEQVLPLAFAAYKTKLIRARQLVEQRQITPEDDIAAVRSTLMTYTRACSAARVQVGSVQKEVERCSASADACDAMERSQLATQLDGARDAWREARVQEILMKVTLGQPEAPSAVCLSW